MMRLVRTRNSHQTSLIMSLVYIKGRSFGCDDLTAMTNRVGCGLIYLYLPIHNFIVYMTGRGRGNCDVRLYHVGIDKFAPMTYRQC